ILIEPAVLRYHDLIGSVRQRTELEISDRIGEDLVDDPTGVEFQHDAHTLIRQIAGGHENLAANGVRDAGAARRIVRVVRSAAAGLRECCGGANRENDEQKNSLWESSGEKSGLTCHNAPPDGNGGERRLERKRAISIFHFPFHACHFSFVIAGVLSPAMTDEKWRVGIAKWNRSIFRAHFSRQIIGFLGSIIVVIKYAGFKTVALTLRVDQLFEFLAGFEIRHAFGGDINRSASFRIAAPPRVALAHAEAAEAAQFDFLS